MTWRAAKAKARAWAIAQRLPARFPKDAPAVVFDDRSDRAFRTALWREFDRRGAKPVFVEFNPANGFLAGKLTEALAVLAVRHIGAEVQVAWPAAWPIANQASEARHPKKGNREIHNRRDH